MLRNLVCLLLASFVASCATAPKETHKSVKEILSAIEANAEKRVAISGTGSISWIGKGKSLAAPGLVLVEWPDKLRLEVQDPLGGLLALLVLSKDSFWWYSSDQKEILTGPLQELGAVGLPFSAADLVRAFLARPDMRLWQKGLLVGQQEIRSIEGKDILLWSDRLDEPLEWRHEEKNARVVVFFEDYANRFGASFPEKLRLESVRGKEREHTISWVWRDWQPMVQNGKKLFQIPQEQHFGRKIKTLP